MNEKLEQDLAREKLYISADSKRLKAFLADELVVALVVFAALWEPLTSAADTEAQIELINSNVIFIVLFRVFYHTIFISLYGATLGKIWQKIFVITQNGFTKPPLLVSLARASMRIVSDLCFFYGLLWAFATPYRQTWHDKLARTIVINV